MPGQPKNQRFYVTIPRGIVPGQHFAVLVNGTQMMVRCPEGNKPGDRLIVTAPRQQVDGLNIQILYHQVVQPHTLPSCRPNSTSLPFRITFAKGSSFAL